MPKEKSLIDCEDNLSETAHRDMFFVHQMIQMRQPNIMLKRNAMASPVPKHVARVNVKSHRTSNILSQDRAKICQCNKWIDSRQRTSKEPHASPKVKNPYRMQKNY